MNKLTRNIFYVVAMAVVALIIWSLLTPVGSKPQSTDISQIVQQVQDNNVNQIDLNGDQVTAKLKNGQDLQAYKEPNSTLKDYGITPDKVPIDITNPNKGSVWPTLLTIFLPVILIGGFLYFMLRQAQGGNNKALSFGQSRARLFTPGAKKQLFKTLPEC